jgi:F-type H+-transporting ATPase subunit delta
MKTSSSKLARRYARALVTLCDERGDGEAVRASLRTLAQVWVETPGALAYLANPTIAVETRRQTLDKVLTAAQAEGTARTFVQVLLDKGRIAELPGIETEFTAMLDARTGRVQADVVSATPLTQPSLDRLRELLARLLAKDVVLHPSVDAELLGGVVVRVGNTVYDASARNHLNRLRHRLLAE